MGWRELEERSNAVTQGVTCIVLGVALGAGFVQGVKLDLSTFLAAGFTCASGVAFLWSAKVPQERAESTERWAMWFLVGGMATMIAKMCF